VSIGDEDSPFPDVLGGDVLAVVVSARARPWPLDEPFWLSAVLVTSVG
jgi:hypothetical protein